MMNYSFLDNTMGSLAFEPFCLDNDHLYGQANTHTNQLLDATLYFNGFNDTILGDDCSKIGSLAKEKETVDLDVDIFANQSLTDFLLGGDSDRGCGVPHSTASLGSPASLSSSTGSLDDLLNEFQLTSPFGSPTSSTSSCPLDDNIFDLDLSTSFASPVSSSSLDDLEFLENIDTVEESKSNDILCPPQVISPTSTTNSMGEMFLNLTLPEADTFSVPEPTVNDHIYAKTPDTDNENSCFDIPSPKSVDSGVSSDDGNEVNAYDFTQSMWKLYNDAGLLEVPTYPTSADVFDFTVTGQTSSNLTGSPLPDVRDTQRFVPYKGKNKTVEQKLRKKAHNRKSACKYRAKKKEVLGNVTGELEQLEEKNKNLKTNVDDLRKEIDYLKSLMLDVIRARLSKNNNTVSLDSLLSAGLMD